jgi:hypothetical protein
MRQENYCFATRNQIIAFATVYYYDSTNNNYYSNSVPIVSQTKHERAHAFSIKNENYWGAQAAQPPPPPPPPPPPFAQFLNM